MTAISGYLSTQDTLLYADNLANVFRGAVAYLPLIQALAGTAQTKIEGDGAANAGLSNIDLKTAIKSSLPGLVNAFDVTRIWGAQNALLSALDNQVRSNLPSGWNFLSGQTVTHVFDQHLARINGSWAAVVTGSANPVAGALTAGYNALGALPNCTSGNAPRVLHTLVGTADYNESLPSGEAAQVALSGSQNSYTYQIAGSVPSGVTKVRLYRGIVGGAAGVYGWLKDVAVVAGAAYPAIPITEGDVFLRLDVLPPAWLSALLLPEFAGLFALSNTGGAFGQPAQSSLTLPIVMTALAMLSSGNVQLNPSSAFLGVGNPPSSGIFARSTVTGSGAQTNQAGTITTANNPGQNVQGFAGATGLQSRVIAALSAGATFTLTYTYYDQAHGWGVPQTQAGATAVHVTGAVGETIAIPVTAGRIVQTAVVTGVSGAATSGEVVIEAGFGRTLSGPTSAPTGAGATAGASTGTSNTFLTTNPGY